MRKRIWRNRTLQRYDVSLIKRGSEILAGVDEAGRGPLAGPVVACAVIVKDFRFKERVDDSKKLTERQRDRAFHEILKKTRLSLAVIEPDRIDRTNIHKASLEAMAQAARALKETPTLCLVDGAHPLRVPFACRSIRGGDGVSFSIACASIAAKVIRDRLMRLYDEHYPAYSFFRHKGYGTLAHREALKRHGPCRIHRRSFRPVAELI